MYSKLLSFPQNIDNSKSIEPHVYSYCLPLHDKRVMCHVLFIQVASVNSRESKQRSLVLFTYNRERPVYHRLLNCLIPSFSTDSFDPLSYLEVLAMQKDKFPLYEVNQAITLKIFGATLYVTISNMNQLPELIRTNYKVITDIWKHLIRGSSFLVLGDSLEDVTESVFCIESLISPLTYYGEVRPNYNIADTIHKSSTPFIIGSTNEFLKEIVDKEVIVVEVPHKQRRSSTTLNNSKSFDDLKKMSSFESGKHVFDLCYDKTMKLLSIFDGYLCRKFPTVKGILDGITDYVFDQEDCIKYVSSIDNDMYGWNDADMTTTYIKFMQTKTFLIYLNDKILSFYNVQALNYIRLVQNVNLNEYSGYQHEIIKSNLKSLLVCCYY